MHQNRVFRIRCTKIHRLTALIIFIIRMKCLGMHKGHLSGTKMFCLLYT